MLRASSCVFFLFPTEEGESEKWYLSMDFPPATIKTEPITEEPPPGLVPSVTLTITAVSTPFEKEEPSLETDTGVYSIFFHLLRLGHKIQSYNVPIRNLF